MTTALNKPILAGHLLRLVTTIKEGLICLVPNDNGGGKELMFLPLVGIVAALLAVVVFTSIHKANPSVTAKVLKTHIPKAISLLVLTAQFSELVKVVEKTSIVNVSAALLLLAVLAAAKSGTQEKELH